MNQAQRTGETRKLIRGILLCVTGILLGILSLVVCCYSFGIDLHSEGWNREAAEPKSIHRLLLIGSLVGFAIAIPLFWVGFFQVSHPKAK